MWPYRRTLQSASSCSVMYSGSSEEVQLAHCRGAESVWLARGRHSHVAGRRRQPWDDGVEIVVDGLLDVGLVHEAEAGVQTVLVRRSKNIAIGEHCTRGACRQSRTPS